MLNVGAHRGAVLYRLVERACFMRATPAIRMRATLAIRPSTATAHQRDQRAGEREGRAHEQRRLEGVDEDGSILRGLYAKQGRIGPRREERAAGRRAAEALEHRAGDADAQRLPGDTRRREQAGGLALLVLGPGMH